MKGIRNFLALGTRNFLALAFFSMATVSQGQTCQQLKSDPRAAQTAVQSAMAKAAKCSAQERPCAKKTSRLRKVSLPN